MAKLFEEILKHLKRKTSAIYLKNIYEKGNILDDAKFIVDALLALSED